jgi:two-component system response regulator HydG
VTDRILIVDDERSMCELLEMDLRLRGLSTASCTSASDAWRAVSEGSFDVVVTDVKMPGMTGIQLCEHITADYPELPVIVMTAFGSMETAVAALRAGAYDFVTKPVEMDLLAAAIQRAVKQRRLQRQVRELSETIDHRLSYSDIIGDSPAMQRIYAQLSQFSPTDTAVLLTGESGTGKELVARTIHRNSKRASQPFVAVNCAAIPEALLESELFGHAKGAFTDARQERQGLFTRADGGTLFLDELGELPLTMQVKLLRALEERTVRPVGSDREVKIDIRLISATNRDLEAAIQDQRFREDLYYRVNVIQIELPPLRSRGTDVLILAHHFIRTFATSMNKPVSGIDNAVAEKLLAYPWPGNVRELRNVVERAMALTTSDRIIVDDLPEKVRGHRGRQIVLNAEDPAGLLPLEQVEQHYILHVLESVSGNRTQAAQVLGLDRKTLYRKLKQYGVE